MATIRAFFPQIRALFSNFRIRAGETSPPSSPLVTRLYYLLIFTLVVILTLHYQVFDFSSLFLHQFFFPHNFSIVTVNCNNQEKIQSNEFDRHNLYLSTLIGYRFLASIFLFRSLSIKT